MKIFIAVQQDQFTPALEPARMGRRIKETRLLNEKQGAYGQPSVLVADGQPDPQPNLVWVIPKPADDRYDPLFSVECGPESFRRARYAYSTANKGGAASTPQNGQITPRAIGARMDAQTGTLTVRLMMYGWSNSPSSRAITA